METYYLSTETITEAYHELTNTNLQNTSVLFTFFILKGCGFNNINHEPLERISTHGLDLTKRLSWLFSPYEVPTDKCDFINPLNMSAWGNNPKEPLSKWLRLRLKNNIIGGATTWRNIIKEDLKQNQIKFTYNYLSEINTLTDIEHNKINLPALAVWSNRFTAFNKKISLGELCKEFSQAFSFTQQEQNALFHTHHPVNLNYSDSFHDASSIRALIGKPDIKNEWVAVQPLAEQQIQEIKENYGIRSFSMDTTTSNYDISTDMLLNLLNNYHQIILSGPPGTSKSHLCTEISTGFDSVKKIQFHPQYSYQQFVGGYVVEKDEVNYRKGILLNFLEDIKQQEATTKHLLIIDEINRANLSQVFGEVIQCLDRNHSTQILIDGELQDIKLPNNLYILGTMNSTDRTLGSVDYALRRRFLNIYCPPNPELLLELCPAQDGISTHDLLQKINENLIKAHKNRELVIGHALFLSDNAKNSEDNKYYWTPDLLEMLFNFKILPIIEEYCYGNSNQIKAVLGENLPLRLQGENFKSAIQEFIYT
ncbi:TPA: McrB family protein [Bacillus cereus]